MSTNVCTFINAAAATSAVRPRTSSSRRASASVRATAAASKASTPAVLGGVTLPAPTTSAARAARVHRRRGAVVMRAEGDGLQRDNPDLEEKFATIGCVRACMFIPTVPTHHILFIEPDAIRISNDLEKNTPRFLREGFGGLLSMTTVAFFCQPALR